MSIEVWWPKLRQQSRDYLIETTATPDLVEEIGRAGGMIRSDAWWVGQSDPTGFFLSDEGSTGSTRSLTARRLSTMQETATQHPELPPSDCRRAVTQGR